MTGKPKFISLILPVLVMLIFSGCESVNNSISKILNRPAKAQEPKELKITPAEQSKANLLRQIERKHENPEAHFQLGQLYQADSLWSKAEDCYRIALNYDPAHRQAQAARIKVLQLAGDTKKAELLADIYMEQAGASAAGSLKLALAFQKQGLDDYAMNGYNQALRLAPNSPKINRQIGYYYLSKNDIVQARDYLNRSFQLDNNQPEVAGELGRLGVEVKIPRKIERNIEKLDKIVEEADE